jgi:hypothetical protein
LVYFCGHLAYFISFWYTYCAKKNLASLVWPRRKRTGNSNNHRLPEEPILTYILGSLFIREEKVKVQNCG